MSRHVGSIKAAFLPSSQPQLPQETVNNAQLLGLVYQLAALLAVSGKFIDAQPATAPAATDDDDAQARSSSSSEQVAGGTQSEENSSQQSASTYSTANESPVTGETAEALDQQAPGKTE
jgi:hypothetical protein